MINRGVMPCDDAKEPWFISSAHTDEDVAETLTAFEDSLGRSTELSPAQAARSFQ